MPPFPKEEIDVLEKLMDAAQEELSPLEELVLPGGIETSAAIHVARCVCRRVVQICIELARSEPVEPNVVPYLKRLSDALVVLARLANQRAGKAHVVWKRKGGPRQMVGGSQR